MAKFGVVIVTYNNEETIIKCLDSIFKNEGDVEVVVVDNNSSDKTVEVLEKYSKKIKVLPQKNNLGFSKGNNVGEKNITSEYVVFLNPDTYLLGKNSLTKLVGVLSENGEFGLIGPRIILTDGKFQKTVRNLPTVGRAFSEYILGKRGTYDFYEPSGQGLQEVESVVGACMVVKKEVFEKVGGWDEKFFLYFEDLELCKRLREKGFKIAFYPEVTIGHILGVSGKGGKTNALLHESAKLYHGQFSYQLIQFILRVGSKLR